MLETSGAEIDPAVFQRENQGDFEITIGLAVGTMERTGELIRLHDGFDGAAATREMVEEIKEDGGEVTEAYESLVESVGGDFMDGIVGEVLGATESPVPEEEYDEAVREREEAVTSLVNHTAGYHDFMRQSLAEAYGEDSEAVDEEAWLATWKRLKQTLKDMPGTLLAEMAGFFDGLAREKFGTEFRHMEEDRGPAVQTDVCARTFYEVMQDHVPRAIVGANRDEWTGYQ